MLYYGLRTEKYIVSPTRIHAIPNIILLNLEGKSRISRRFKLFQDELSYTNKDDWGFLTVQLAFLQPLPRSVRAVCCIFKFMLSTIIKKIDFYCSNHQTVFDGGIYIQVSHSSDVEKIEGFTLKFFSAFFCNGFNVYTEYYSVRETSNYIRYFAIFKKRSVNCLCISIRYRHNTNHLVDFSVEYTEILSRITFHFSLLIFLQ